MGFLVVFHFLASLISTTRILISTSKAALYWVFNKPEMALIQNLYSDRTKDFFHKVALILRVFNRYITKFSITAHVLVLILLFDPGLYSQVKHLTNTKCPGIPLLTASSMLGPTPFYIPQTLGSPQAMLDVYLTSCALPGIAITGQMNIRRFRCCDSYKAYLAEITSLALTLSPSLHLTLAPWPPLSFAPNPSPPGTHFKIRI